MANLYPYIFSEDARNQADFYANALNGEVVSVQTFEQAPNVDDAIKDKVMHLTLSAADQIFFMADSVNESVKQGTQINLVLEYKTEDEARSVFENLSEGGSVLMPFDKMFWGAMFGRVEDKYGLIWQITTEHE
ncbi:VOC family protein [Pseudalkalibacillus berkeleyi]|uniref:VOC family protein n=1 Tax=Pseudalkalibacillus berkeleyi TaxID=1069813 RepID=A0ABS9H489_9BACL|nr:VOC family protein [Pseudalkalibacillus berkeleyi]MCF6138490.1 VOC family protein [Pseudalkalibacillus berkeleyi]